MRKTILLLLIVLTIFSFVSCQKDPPHEHSFSSGWVYDENYHWHESSCGHDVTSGNAPHNWDAGIVTTEPTHTAAGVRTYTCTVCGAIKTESVSADTEAHTFSTDWSSDANYHWHAATCGHTILKSEQSVHTWNNGVVTTEPTHTEAGVKTYTCTVCGQTKEEVVPANSEAHTFSTDWSSDADTHWHAATCVHTTLKSQQAEHTWNAGVITTPATCTEAGVKTFTCTVCGRTRTESVPATGHAYDDGVITTPAGCTTTGVKTFTCANCGDTYTEDIPATGHAYSEEWTTNATYHWHAATCEHTDQKGSYEAHTFPSKATAVLQNDGTYKFGYTCTTCGYTRLVESAKVGDIGPAGGIVFYDKGEYSDGWRFLEAAPNDLKVVYGEPTVDNSTPGYSSGTVRFVFGYYRTTSDGDNLYVNGTTTYNAANCTGSAVGTGKANTDLLVAAMGNSTYTENSGATKTAQYAAKLCADLEYNGFDDWFLPSLDEMALLYTENYSRFGLVKLSGVDTWYATSSEYSSYVTKFLVRGMSYYYGNQSYSIGQNTKLRETSVYIRPIRLF